MNEYATVLVEGWNQGDYRATPVSGGWYFSLAGSEHMNLRHEQPVRITRAQSPKGEEARKRGGDRVAWRFHLQNWDVVLGQALDQHESPYDLSEISALILYDPLQEQKEGRHFISIARSEKEVQAAIDKIFHDWNFGEGNYDEKCDTFFIRTPGKRAYASRDFIERVEQNAEQEGMLFIPLEKLVSKQKGKTYDWGIDEGVLRLCLQYTKLPRRAD
jgi:hypothetical protein